MLAECALATLDPDRTTAGVLTPAAAFGLDLVPRLEAAGLTFDVEPS